MESGGRSGSGRGKGKKGKKKAVTTMHQSGQKEIQKSLNAVAVVTPNEMSVKKAMKKKRKRKNGTLKVLAGTNDSDQVMTTVSLKEGTSNDEKMSPLIATQPMKKKKSLRTQLPSIDTVTKQTMGGEDLSSKRTIAQVENVSTKLLTQRTRKSERVTTTVDVSAAVASPCKKVEANMVSAGSMSMLPKDEFQVVVWRSERVNFAKCDRIFSVKSEMANINESRSRGQY
ncbi:unnamed protein product [Peronospora farinosa]|uniref:Uncharacterized protein n=1 Tax=Peronospora farinosa TaxID=134698 RepID=A0AAV0US56_9STRA|nr:unnamed protein product [Peronospora farinosa]